jgi:hypothetical protein
MAEYSVPLRLPIPTIFWSTTHGRIGSARSASQWRTCGRSDPARILEADVSETPSCRLIWDTLTPARDGWI